MLLKEEKALKQKFLDHYADVKTSIAKAAKDVDLSFQQVYSWKKKDLEFAENLELIEMMVADEIGAAIKELALSVSSKDATKAAVTAAIYYHKGKKPEFRDNARQVQVSGELSLKEKCKRNTRRSV